MSSGSGAEGARARYLPHMSAHEELPRRHARPVRVFRLGEEPSDDLTSITSAEQRFEMVAMLSARMVEFNPTPPSPPMPRGHPVRVVRQ
jgi:hypothetical protein